jgi:uncharacterized protein
VIPALAVGAGAIAQWVSGIGFSLVCAPILIATLGPREGVRVALVLSSILNVSLVAGRRGDLMVREGALLLVPAMAITPFVAVAVRSAAALLVGWRWHRGRHPIGAVVAGALSGTMNVIGSIGGPALALYTVNADWPQHRTRPTLQVIFLLSNVVALAALGLPKASHLAGPAIGLGGGWIVGRWLDPKVPHDVARVATLVVAAAGGAAAVLRAWSAA